MSGNKRTVCPECGKHASGNFCQNCGAQLGGKFCTECGGPIRGSFCNQCGAPAKGGGQARVRSGGAAAPAGNDSDLLRSQNLPWWIAGIAAFAVIFVLGWNVIRTNQLEARGQGAAPAAVPTVDLSQMSPRQRADELFNRVMGASEAGDTLTVGQFMPMALQAYEAARPLDADGLFHLGLLHRIAGAYDTSLAVALEMLEAEPNHILALEVAGEAAAAMGDDAAAAAYFQRILDSYDTEIGRPLPEYEGHSNFFPIARSAAVEFLAGR